MVRDFRVIDVTKLCLDQSRRVVQGGCGGILPEPVFPGVSHSVSPDGQARSSEGLD
jgi:hypothetical protein